MKTKQHNLIIGRGQIGSAIYACHDDKSKVWSYDPTVRGVADKNLLEQLKGITNCMHICFPFYDKDSFIYAVSHYVSIVEPEIVMIHSTVAPGTTREIYRLHKDKIICYSPCKGKHPELYESIKNKFMKFYAILPVNRSTKYKVKQVMKIFNNTYYANKVEELEWAKLLCTTEYAHHIAIATEYKRICDEEKLDFSTVYTAFRSDYNQGYKSLNLDEFTRPILHPCDGKIGGHCVIPNIKILKRYVKRTWLTYLNPKSLLGKNK